MDSLSVKDAGFIDIFSDHKKNDVEKFLEYHHLNGGISRFEKIKYFFEKILNKKISDHQIHSYANKFSSIMKKYLIDPNKIISDTFEFIKNTHKKYDLHIVSGSEEKELRWLCKNLELDRYFLTINGSPVPKPELVANLIKDYNYSLDEYILIGDSINDYNAAEKNGISFFGYNNLSLKNIGYGYIKSFKKFELI